MKVTDGSGITVGIRSASVPRDDKDFGDFVRCLYQKDYRRLESHYQSKAALAEQGGTIGGYTVPIDMAREVLTEAAEHSFFLRLGTQVPLTTRETVIPHARVTGGAVGVSPFYGQIVFTWGMEGVTLPETEPAFQATTLVSNTLSGYSLISNAMLADVESGQLGRYVRELLGRAAAWAFDYACFQGDGIGKPQGLLNAPGGLDVARVAGNDVQVGDLAAMAGKLIPAGYGAFEGATACWGIHPSVLTKLFTVSSWQIGQPPGAGNVNEPGSFYLNGCPAYVTEKMNALGTRGDVALFVSKLYLVGIRQDVQIDVSRDEPTAFARNQSVLRVTFRADGRLRLNSSVTLADGTSTAAAVVVLK